MIVDEVPVLRSYCSAHAVCVLTPTTNWLVSTLQVPAQGCERWVESLGLPKRFEGWRPWTVGGKVAGGVIEYQVPPSRVSNYNGIEYATVHGAGHGVPQHRPQFALEMLRAAIDERELPRSRDDLEARL